MCLLDLEGTPRLHRSHVTIRLHQSGPCATGRRLEDPLVHDSLTRAVKSRGTSRHKKPPAQELFELDESEVELDSLGLFFMQLIDADSPQEEAEKCHADAAEVIHVSSDSEPLPRKKTRRVIRKVRFSHPHAYLDPNFLLKKPQHESKRLTQSGGS